MRCAIRRAEQAGGCADRRTPADVAAAATPEQVRLLRDRLGWDGGERLYRRHYRSWQGLAAQRMLAAWRDTRSNVLSVRGESDIAAIYDEDPKLIAEAVNHYRPARCAMSRYRAPATA